MQIENMEEHMRDIYFKKAAELKEDIICEDNGPVLGLETEYSLLYDEDLRPATGDVVEEIIGEDSAARKMELGAHQIELVTKPINGKSISTLCDILKESERSLKESASKKGLRVLRMGALPNLSPFHTKVGNTDKYRMVPGYYDRLRNESNIDSPYPLNRKVQIGGVEFPTLGNVGLFNAVQINLQAKNLEDAIDKLNRSLMIGPYIAVLTGNSRIINHIDTKIEDIRLLVWESLVSVAGDDIDIKNNRRIKKERRVGLPLSYFKDIDDYFARAGSYPFIMHSNPAEALNIAIGMYWQDTRLKFINKKPVIEFRLISMQPTPEEDIAAMVFYLGRLNWSQINKESLLDIWKVNDNRHSALKLGLDGGFYFGNEKKIANCSLYAALEDELVKAEKGLEQLGFKSSEINDYLGILRKRVILRKTPARKFLIEAELSLDRAMGNYLL